MEDGAGSPTGSESAVSQPIEKPVVHTFFGDVSICEFAFGMGALGVNCLSFGMMLNIPTLTLHNMMYAVAPKGLLHNETTDQDRIRVCKSILDYWLNRNIDLSPKKRFKQLHQVFVYWREKEIAQKLKEKFEANEAVNLEMFLKFDLGRLGPYVLPPDEVDTAPEGDEEKDKPKENAERKDSD